MPAKKKVTKPVIDLKKIQKKAENARNENDQEEQRKLQMEKDKKIAEQENKIMDEQLKLMEPINKEWNVEQEKIKKKQSKLEQDEKARIEKQRRLMQNSDLTFSKDNDKAKGELVNGVFVKEEKKRNKQLSRHKQFELDLTNQKQNEEHDPDHYHQEETQEVDDWEEIEIPQETPSDIPDNTNSQDSPHTKDNASKNDKCKTNNKPKTNSKENDKVKIEPEKDPNQAENKTKIESKLYSHLNEQRSPIICILGHVDVGKTKLLDKIRSTNVQEGEAGGITQQIGATFFPVDRVMERVRLLDPAFTPSCPGLLVIDTPGHESFSNLRSRGSSLCDIAILVVDLMHGIERQTLESLEMLKARKIPFLIAINKVDRCSEWQSADWTPYQQSWASQNDVAKQDFKTKFDKLNLQLMEQDLNCKIYTENTNEKEYYSIVPTSAHSGEGIPDILYNLLRLTNLYMKKRLEQRETLNCVVMDVKRIEGHGTTIDVILVNGVLKERDHIVVMGLNGPIRSQVKALLTPKAMKEQRTATSDFDHHKEIHAAIGLKIAGPDFDGALAGSALFVYKSDEELEEQSERLQDDFKNVMNSLKTQPLGVHVQASTIGSLEALLQFLSTSNIPVSTVGIGTIQRQHVVKINVMKEKKPEQGVILSFDVKMDPDARQEAKKLDIKVFEANIIYHLFDAFTKYMAEWREREKAEARKRAVFPCVLKIDPQCVFRKSEPIVLGVNIVQGVLHTETPVCIKNAEGEILVLGIVTSIEKNHKQVDSVREGDVAIKIEPKANAYVQGRHFTHEHQIISRITRESIDALKEYFRDEQHMTKDDWQLVVKLKKFLAIV